MKPANCINSILSENEFHLWYTRPKDCQDADLLQRYKGLLNKEETERQQRFVFEKDRHDALITRAFIRDLLSHYMEKPAADWQFIKGEKGKPEIINPSIPLRFNLSHTKNLIICAVTLNHDIGCDVEYMERKSDYLAIADRFFSKVESKELFSLSKSEQRQRFFDYWTLKESYIKAWGLGLAIPLSDFSFYIGESQTDHYNNNIQLGFAPCREDTAAHWQSWLFYPGDQHRIAVSVRKIDADINTVEQGAAFNFQFFESTPLVSFKQVDSIIVPSEV